MPGQPMQATPNTGVCTVIKLYNIKECRTVQEYEALAEHFSIDKWLLLTTCIKECIWDSAKWPL